MAVSWSPTPAQVKGLVPQRVAGGPFTTTTTPTLAQVQDLGDGVAEEVLAEVGGTVPAELDGQANWVARLGTAAYVELGFFPEQQDESNSPGALLYQRYTEALARLRAAVDAAGGTVPGEARLGSLRTPSATVADYEALYGPSGLLL